MKTSAKQFFKKPFIQLALGDRLLLDSKSVQEHLSNGATVTAVATTPLMAETRSCFVMWCPLEHSPLATSLRAGKWMSRKSGISWSQVREVMATKEAFAALLADGSVVTWGAEDAGGDSSTVQDRLKHVQHIAATRATFAAILADGSVVTLG
ncbi:Sardh [Symbiodinium natans]|uniref:Sardh protein n=1 Tax=Symbiodinium natans TaxID=878477 RepID=A0A812UTQ1_9DINO|nr:Sardh [Symbiodinium natans]